MRDGPVVRTRRLYLGVLLTIPLLLLGAGKGDAQDWKEFRSARQAAAYKSVSVELIYGAGRLHIAPAKGNTLYDVRMRFDADRFVPLRSWTEEDGRGKFRVALTGADTESGDPSSPDIRLDHFNVNLNLRDLKKLDDSGGQLELELSRAVPTELTINVGAARSTLELGGVPVTLLELNTGASETRLSFDQPNPARMKALEIKVGAASFRAKDLGNADFERFSFHGGVGDVTLDFGGEWQRSAAATVRMGVGSLTVRVPRSLGVRISRKSFLSSFDAPGLEKVAKSTFQTPNWGEAETRLDLLLDAALGSVKVERID